MHMHLQHMYSTCTAWLMHMQHSTACAPVPAQKCTYIMISRSVYYFAAGFPAVLAELVSCTWRMHMKELLELLCWCTCTCAAPVLVLSKQAQLTNLKARARERSAYTYAQNSMQQATLGTRKKDARLAMVTADIDVAIAIAPSRACPQLRSVSLSSPVCTYACPHTRTACGLRSYRDI